MLGPNDLMSSSRSDEPGIDRIKLRLAVLGVLVLAIFGALFSRLWFLQVLAADDFQVLANENRVRRIESEPPRGRILDMNGIPLVDNRQSLSLTLDREVLETPVRKRAVLTRVARLLDVKPKSFDAALADTTVSPYKPIAIAFDVPLKVVQYIEYNPEDFQGIHVEELPVRYYPQGKLAAQVLGYVNEISPEQLEVDYFKKAEPRYAAGDIVGQLGLERTYDRFLRGAPQVQKVVVNSAGKVVDSDVIQEEEAGPDLVTSIDLRIQKVAEKALAAGIMAARSATYEAPDGGVVVMDPQTGEIRAMASFPTYDPAILADGITTKEFDSLGQGTETGTDDALLNRPIQAGVPPGSTFKLVTGGAAMANGIASSSTVLNCPGFVKYTDTTFYNWTSADSGAMGFPRSLEVSCNTFYYELGWRMEQAFGAALGDGSEKFQDYARTAGFGDPTGVDLPFETGGRVPDERWCQEYSRATDGLGCAYGWLPGYTVNMSIGQGDLIVSPMQMAVTYAAVANGGKVLQPRFGSALGEPDEATGDEEVIKQFKTKVSARLPLDDIEIGVLQQGLEDVVMGASGTARGAFAGFPLDKFPVAGKTGTAQIGSVDSGLNFAWFVSYAPVDNPEYVVAVYLEKAGHGGESAGPVARQIYEGIFNIDNETEVQLGQDASG
jgi:penicillin-binding protein 2